MQEPRSYNLGRFKVLAEDLKTLNPKTKKQRCAWNSPFGWELERDGKALLAAGWRTPNLDQLSFICELFELGVGAPNLEPDWTPVGDYEESDAGYWSSSRPANFYQSHEYRVITLWENAKGDLRFEERYQQAEYEEYRIRLVKEIKT